MTDALSLDRIARIGFKPTTAAHEFLENTLRVNLLPGERYKAARLAIARSLHEPDPPEPLPKGTEFAMAIPGEALFGEERATWVCLIADAWPQLIDSPDVLRSAVEAHWHRGAKLLKSDLAEARDSDVDFAIGIAALAGLAGTEAAAARSTSGKIVGSARVSIQVGEVSIDMKENKPVELSLNEAGHSPHMALMGKIRSGKTRTGIVMAEQIFSATQIPILFIDPKGEFVKDGRFVGKTEWSGRTFADRFPGAKAIDVGRMPVPLDFLSAPDTASGHDLNLLAGAFKSSFQNCVRVKGDIALNNLREVVLALIHARQAVKGAAIPSKAVSLRSVRDALREKNEDEARAKDSIEARLGELVDLNLFEPQLSPDAFFSQSWVIGLGATPNEAKRLVMFLLLDALAAHVIGQQDAPTDAAGHRKLRHLLVIDEAREILSYKHDALSQLLRKAGSKGEVVMLLSQSPDDFDKEEDDFLSQMGTVAVFASATQSVKSLRPVMGKKVRPEDLGDAALAKGVALVKLPGREPSKILAWR